LVGAGQCVFSALASTLLVVVLIVYFVIDLPRIRATLYRLVPHSRRPRAILLGDEIFAKVGGYVLGNLLISLIADVARAYLDLRALQMQLAVLRKNIEVAQKYVDFVQERFNRGITNELDVTLAERELGQLQAQVPPLIAQINAARYVIAVLIGEFPEHLGKELPKGGMLPASPQRIRSGLPIDLLRRRPAGFRVLTGEDAQYYEALSDGADGAILLSAHVATETFARVRTHLKAGDRAAARG